MESTEKIGIISDTHGILRNEVIEALDGCSMIFHAGDVGDKKILDRLLEIAPTFVVRGNTDTELGELPDYNTVPLMGMRTYMTHKKKDLPKDLSMYRLVVYGHSHRYEEQWIGKTLFLNPGSCGPKRFNQKLTMAIINKEDYTNQFSVTRIDIPNNRESEKPAERDLKSIIERVIVDVQKGRSISEISVKYRIDEGLAEVICRLYLTHPGVDADGIMTKMGL